MKVRIGIGFGGVSGDELSGLVKKTAQLDIDSLWLSEQLSSRAVDPMMGMAWALARTSRLKVGTAVNVLPGRNPVVYAKQLASLASLAPRRVLPVVGLGPARPAERDAFPVPAGRRGEVFDESLVVVRRLLSEPSVTHHGEFFHLDGLGLGDRPERPLDLWLGGGGPKALRRVGRFGDGWLPSFITPAEAAAGRAAVDAAAAEAGRAVDPEHFGVSMRVALDGPPPGLKALRARRPEIDPADYLPVGWTAIRAKVEEFVAVGFSKFVLYPAVRPEDLPRFLDRFAAELKPLET
ncbi:TIGR03854 family LLM class F420-dependent oxidoreductase [Pseudofrankia sp. DC12]|uniref:TIGR03854 family LLM class F420-dependent oxidoreductase n=1 Tax=Pseudofrankia sp. DC12 TaxID=683315 RepID=UPI0005F8312F|nr:TIGR03854 family LLM class F420-dependent oxidoreductase [Pseudofrankia sp. DC12]